MEPQMNIKDILKKLTEGKPLTEEEKAFAGSFDPDAASRAAVDAAAAAARRDAETKLQKALADLQAEQAAKAQFEAKVKEYETDTKNKGGAANEAIKLLTQKLDSMETELKQEREAKAKLTRETRINGIIQKAGIKYVDGVDVTEVNGSLFRKLAALEDDAIEAIEKADRPEKEPVHGHLFAKHKDAWKAAIADDSGGGSGAVPPGSRPSRMPTGANPWKKETYNLTQQIELKHADPSKAAQLMAEAGVKT